MKVLLHVASKWATARNRLRIKMFVFVWIPFLFCNMNQSTVLVNEVFFLFMKQCTKPKHVVNY